MAGLKVCQGHECNNVFSADTARKYCSAKCRQQAYRDRHAKVPFKADYVIKRCVNCGTKFNDATFKKLYCSLRCKQQHYRERKKLSKETLS